MASANLGRFGGKLRLQRALWAYLFLAVPMAFFLYIRLWPALQAFDLSLREWNILGDARPYIGFENYIWLAGDERFRRALLNTALYTLAGVPSQLVLGLFVGLLLNGITRFQGFFPRAVLHALRRAGSRRGLGLAVALFTPLARSQTPHLRRHTASRVFIQPLASAFRRYGGGRLAAAGFPNGPLPRRTAVDSRRVLRGCGHRRSRAVDDL